MEGSLIDLSSECEKKSTSTKGFSIQQCALKFRKER